MVGDVDKMSDAELRTKLREFGFPVMPTTRTTREVMVKKLKLLLKSKSKVGSTDGRRPLVRKDKNRRVLAAPVSSTTTRITKKSSVEPEEDVTQDDITTSETFEQSIQSPQTPQSLMSHSRAPSRSSSCSAKKRKNNEQAQAMERICKTLEKESDEFDSVGANVAHKLRRMDNEQKMYAELLINNILFFGIQKRLCNESHVCLNSSHFFNMASNLPLMQPQYNQQQQTSAPLQSTSTYNQQQQTFTLSQSTSTDNQHQQTFAPSQPTYNQQQQTFHSTESMDAESGNFVRNTSYIPLETTNAKNQNNGNTTDLPGSLTELLVLKNK